MEEEVESHHFCCDIIESQSSDAIDIRHLVAVVTIGEVADSPGVVDCAEVVTVSQSDAASRGVVESETHLCPISLVVGDMRFVGVVPKVPADRIASSVSVLYARDGERVLKGGVADNRLGGATAHYRVGKPVAVGVGVSTRVVRKVVVCVVGAVAVRIGREYGVRDR